MRPMTEFRISLCHIFLKLISKTKLCIWNLICAIIQFPYLQKCRLFSVYLSFQGSMCLERAMRIVTVEYVPPSFFERINLNHGCILDFYLCTVTNSATERRAKYTPLAPLSTELNTEIQKSWIPTALITQKRTPSLNTRGVREVTEIH